MLPSERNDYYKYYLEQLGASTSVEDLKREGFVSKRINYVQGGYSIVVAPPGFKEDEIPHEIITTKYNLRK